MQLKPAPGRSYKERASTTESRPSTTGITTSTKRTMREEGTSKSGASQRGTGKLSGASSQARRTLPATGVGGSLNSGFLCLNETAPRWERLRARSSTHGVNNSRPSPAGARPGSTPPLNQGVSREIDPSDYAPKEFIVQSSDLEISRFSQRFLAVSKMFTAVVSRPRRSADRRFPGDAPTVGDWETGGRRGRADQETRKSRSDPTLCVGRRPGISSTSHPVKWLLVG